MINRVSCHIFCLTIILTASSCSNKVKVPRGKVTVQTIEDGVISGTSIPDIWIKKVTYSSSDEKYTIAGSSDRTRGSSMIVIKPDREIPVPENGKFRISLSKDDTARFISERHRYIFINNKEHAGEIPENDYQVKKYKKSFFSYPICSRKVKVKEINSHDSSNLNVAITGAKKHFFAGHENILIEGKLNFCGVAMVNGIKEEEVDWDSMDLYKPMNVNYEYDVFMISNQDTVFVGSLTDGQEFFYWINKDYNIFFRNNYEEQIVYLQ